MCCRVGHYAYGDNVIAVKDKEQQLFYRHTAHAYGITDFSCGFARKRAFCRRNVNPKSRVARLPSFYRHSNILILGKVYTRCLKILNQNSHAVVVLGVRAC